MKKFSTLFLSIVLVLTVSAQRIDAFYSDDGKPIALKVSNETTSKKILLTDSSDEGFVRFDFEGVDITVDLNAREMKTGKKTFYLGNEFIKGFEPGSLPEGDLVSGMELSTDGKLLFVSYCHSGNIYVYKSETYETLAIINTSRDIIDMAITDSRLYVCCREPEKIYVFDLTDYSILNSFSIDENACQIEVNSDETIVYVGFYSWMDGWVNGYSIPVGHEIFSTDEPRIHANGTTSEYVGRTMINHTSFSLSPNDEFFVAAHVNLNYTTVFDALTGESVTTLFENSNRASYFSKNGDTLFSLALDGDTDLLILRRIDCSDFSVIDSLMVFQEMSGASSNMAINEDGSKILIADFFHSNYVVFDFDKGVCEKITTTQVAASANIFCSTDKRYAFIQHYDTYRIFDMKTNEFRGNFSYSLNLGENACAAIDNHRVFVSSYEYSDQDGSHEGWFVFDYTDPDNVGIERSIVAGDSPEADVVSSATLYRDGRKLYATNTLTENLSIIDIGSQTVDTIYQLPDRYDKITPIPNSHLVFLSSNGQAHALLFDPLLLESIAEFNVTYVNSIYTSRDGINLYAFTTKGSGRIYKIEINGAQSEVVDQLIIPDYKGCTVFFMYTTINVDAKVTSAGLSPDGSYFVCGAEDANTMESYIHVIKTDSLEIVASVPIEEGCIYGYAFTSDSKRVCALSFNEAKPIVYLDGENSYLENLVPNYLTSYSADYSEEEDLFYILNKTYTYSKVDPSSGKIMETVAFTEDGDYSWQLILDKSNEPIIRQNTELIYKNIEYKLPGVSKEFHYNSEAGMCIIPIPGPDAVCIFDPLQVGMIDMANRTTQQNVMLSPNPANDYLTISSETVFDRVEIIDSRGKHVYQGKFSNRKTTIQLGSFSPGIYFVRICFGNKFESKKLIVN